MEEALPFDQPAIAADSAGAGHVRDPGDLLLAELPADAPLLVMGRRGAAKLFADILVASEDLSS